MKDESNINYSDPKIFEEFFREHYQSLLQFATYYVRDVQTAQDVVQDVFYNLWKNREHLDHVTNMKTYLYTATRNQALKKKRWYNRVIKTFVNQDNVDLVDFSSQDVFELKELYEQIEQVIKNFPPKCRTVFYLSRFEGLSNKEIAEIQSVSIKTVEAQITKAIKILRKEIFPHLSQ